MKILQIYAIVPARDRTMKILQLNAIVPARDDSGSNLQIPTWCSSSASMRRLT
jgi:hypothetical protein